jgi:hypothetical protein
MGKRAARGLRAVLLAAIVALYVVSIPWYRDSEAAASVWLGLPDWVAVALLCYAGVAFLNTFAWLLTDIPERDENDESEKR